MRGGGKATPARSHRLRLFLGSLRHAFLAVVVLAEGLPGRYPVLVGGGVAVVQAGVPGAAAPAVNTLARAARRRECA